MTEYLGTDGYPTEEFLEQLKNWDPMDFVGLVQAMNYAWKYHNYITFTWEDGNIVKVECSTGGWSGNEDIIDSINPVWHSLYFHSLHRGGHWVFKNDRKR